MRVFSLLVFLPIVYGLGAPRLLGGYEDSNVDEKTKNEMAKFALQEVNKNAKDTNSLRQFSKVVSVKTQVVSGINYDIVMEVKRGDTVELCEVVVYDVPWTDERTLTSSSCKPEPSPLGGEKSVDLDKDVLAAVTFVTTSYNQGINSVFHMVASKVENAKKQTTAGTLYSFDITFMPTNCMNSEENFKKTLPSQGCPINKAGTKKRCSYKVSFQAWRDPKYQIESQKCGEETALTSTKSEMASKLKDLLSPHTQAMLGDLMLKGAPLAGLEGQTKDKPSLNDLMTPQQMLGGLGLGNKIGDLSNHISPLKKRDISSIKDLQPLLADIGKKVLSAYQQNKKDYLNEDGKVDLDSVLGKDGHDTVNHGLEKLLGADGHDLLQHGLDQLLGGDGHDNMEHGLDNLLGGDDHDKMAHGNLIGGGDHDYKPHGNLIGGGDHDYKKHGNLIGGGDHDYKKHGNQIGGGDHDYKPHGNLIGGGDHDYKKHGNLIGGGDHDYKKHGGQIGGDGHDLCHMGHFKEFMIKHEKSYGSVDEENKRFKVFCDNMAHARRLNETEQGTAVYGATKFADLTPDEFRQMYLSKKNWADIPNKGESKMWRAKIPARELGAPTSYDWRDHGAVTPVKNQGQCGSCWAFSTTGNIEGQWKIKRGNLVSLSEQELVDCDKLDEGCNGGLPSNAYMSIMKLGGLETEGDYKYEGDDEKCIFNKSEVAVKINGAVNISSDEGDMAAWLAQNGPISIGINANAMQFYFGGISHPWKIFCNPSNLDHGVLIVGYGVEGSEPYWIVKNSWGPDWGEKGYYRVYRGGGVCGLNTMCTSAVVN